MSAQMCPLEESPADSTKARAAYDAARELHRHESTLLFAQVSVYMGAVGVIANAVLKYDNLNLLAAAGLFGVILGLPYLAIAIRATTHMRDACEVARKAEQECLPNQEDFWLYRKRGEWRLCGGKTAAIATVGIVIVASAAMAIYGLTAK